MSKTKLDIYLPTLLHLSDQKTYLNQLKNEMDKTINKIVLGKLSKMQIIVPIQ